MKTLASLGDLRDKRVLVRADFNVPLDGDRITDDGRIRAALPTIQALQQAGATLIIAAHLGRPQGVGKESEFSLAPVAQRLQQLLNYPVHLAPGVADEHTDSFISGLEARSVALLENVRFDWRETSKNAVDRDELARHLASYADFFVSDGFGVVHRQQASVFDIATHLPSAAGLLVENEIRALARATAAPERPYVVVLGGAKVSDKLGVIENLLDKADTLCIGGGMVFTFLAAQGHDVGLSLLEEDQLDVVRGYLDAASQRNVSILLPTDIRVGKQFSVDSPAEVVAANEIPADSIGLDIGPESEELFRSTIAQAKTVVWNGPMGVFEFPQFAGGTKAVAQGLQEATAAGGFSIVGGGDSAAAVRQLGFDEAKFSHISTGGGASLEFLEGIALPGIEVLS